MPTRPRIGVTARSPLALAVYSRCIELAGGQVMVLDPWMPRQELRRSWDALEGILLPGGAGIAWLWRRRQVIPLHRRDGGWFGVASADVQLARWALVEDRPILGVCRGAQMMALAAAGRLDRDVPHHQLRGVYPAHQIRVAHGSRLYEVLGSDCLPVNSRHRKAVRSLPADSGLAVAAWSAEDGVVEGIEGQGRGFALGVQFHPENLVDFHEPSRRLFLRFVEACRRHGRRRIG